MRKEELPIDSKKEKIDVLKWTVGHHSSSTSIDPNKDYTEGLSFEDAAKMLADESTAHSNDRRDLVACTDWHDPEAKTMCGAIVKVSWRNETIEDVIKRMKDAVDKAIPQPYGDYSK